MCLNTITSKNPIKSGIGWKVVFSNGYGISTPVFGRRIVKDRWTKAIRHRVHSSYDWKHYMTGFHIFLAREAAQYYKEHYVGGFVVAVKYRKARVLGTQCGFECVVADEMMVPTKTVKKGQRG